MKTNQSLYFHRVHRKSLPLLSVECKSGRFHELSAHTRPITMNPVGHNLGQHDPNQKVMEWLNRLSGPGLALDLWGGSFNRQDKVTVNEASGSPLLDDWQTIGALCGHAVNDLINAGTSLAANRCRNRPFPPQSSRHRKPYQPRFLTARTDLPSPLSRALRALSASRPRRCRSNLVRGAGNRIDPRRPRYGGFAGYRRVRKRP